MEGVYHARYPCDISAHRKWMQITINTHMLILVTLAANFVNPTSIQPDNSSLEDTKALTTDTRWSRIKAASVHPNSGP